MTAEQHYDGIGRFYAALPELNIEVLRQAVKWAEYEHELTSRGEDGLWDQMHWGMVTDCGTKCCIAGYVAQEAGYTLVNAQGHHTEGAVSYGLKEGEEFTLQYGSIAPKHEIPVIARKELGLTPSEARFLFEGENSIESVRSLATKIAESRGEEL